MAKVRFHRITHLRTEPCWQRAELLDRLRREHDRESHSGQTLARIRRPYKPYLDASHLMAAGFSQSYGFGQHGSW
jgi:hypothetical protein